MKYSATAENEQLVPTLKDGGTTIKDLPHNGYLFLEHDVPFLMIYRQVSNDTVTQRLARTGASYLIIGDGDFHYFKNYVNELTEKMSARFGTFIIIEVYTGHAESTEFVIKGPSHKLPVSLDVLKAELEKIKSKKYKIKLSARVEQTKDRRPESDEKFFSIEDIKNRGGTFIGLEVPPVYFNEAEKLYPLYFKKFRNHFAKAIQKSVYEFIRIQTSSKLASYSALGKRKIHKEVFKIDKKLTEIENSYQFLLLVAPVNIQSLRDGFFKSHFKDIESYHYRLLPIDPDILKRKLYNLRIEEIDDPALSYLFDEKREEIDQQLTMLKERGSKNFFYSSVRLYKGLEKNIVTEAEMILQNIPENTDDVTEKMLNAEEFAKLAEEEFDFFREQAPDFTCKVHIRKDVNIIMVSKGELYLPADYTLTERDARALIQHEIGTHALTYYNGSQQPLSQLAVGLADYDALQEGMAVLSEYLIGGLSGNRLRILAGRVIAGQALLDGADFATMFNLLHTTYGFSKEPAFNITSRMFQGGGFLKDVIYLKGLVHLKEYIMNGGDLEFLLSGKFALKHLPTIKDLTDRGLLQPLKIKPRYLNNSDYKEKINNIKKGISLSKLIEP